jgi:hypothetical protein
MAINTITLNTYLVRAADGSIDHDATTLKFQGDLLKYEAERETEAETVGAAVNAVFDQFKGTRLNMPAVTSYALTHLNVQPENFKTLTERVQGFIRDHSGERESGALFSIAKGKHGGVCRWADQPVKPAE